MLRASEVESTRGRSRAAVTEAPAGSHSGTPTATSGRGSAACPLRTSLSHVELGDEPEPLRVSVARVRVATTFLRRRSLGLRVREDFVDADVSNGDGH